MVWLYTYKHCIYADRTLIYSCPKVAYTPFPPLVTYKKWLELTVVILDSLHLFSGQRQTSTVNHHQDYENQLSANASKTFTDSRSASPLVAHGWVFDHQIISAGASQRQIAVEAMPWVMRGTWWANPMACSAHRYTNGEVQLILHCTVKPSGWKQRILTLSASVAVRQHPFSYIREYMLSSHNVCNQKVAWVQLPTLLRSNLDLIEILLLIRLQSVSNWPFLTLRLDYRPFSKAYNIA